MERILYNIARASKAAFYVLVAGPGVLLLVLLAFYSDFSFVALASDYYEDITVAASRPATPGYVNVLSCTTPADGGHVDSACSAPSIKAVRVEQLSLEVATRLRAWYWVSVVLTAFTLLAFRLFRQSSSTAAPRSLTMSADTIET